MINFTPEEVVQHYAALMSSHKQCEDGSCDRCKMGTSFIENPDLCNLFIQLILKPKLSPLFMYDCIQIGIALAEKRQLEELLKK